MTSTLLSWRRTHSNRLFAIYSAMLFALALTILGRAWLAGELVLHGGSGLAIAVCSYVLAIFIILLGFSTPRFAYVSLDRITQAGLILAFGPLDAALINGVASFSYPIIAQRQQYGVPMALVRSMHNSAMFSLMIYFAGLAYLRLGGAIPVMQLDMHSAIAFCVLVFCMQFANSAFLHIRAVVMAVPRRLMPDWYSHAIEIPVAIVGLLTALIYNGTGTAVFALFLLMLASVIVVAKFLNEVTVALKRRIKQVVTVNRIAKAISSSVQLDHLVQVVRNEAAQLIDISEFYVGVRNGDNGRLEFKEARRSGKSVDIPGSGPLELMNYCMEHQLPLHMSSQLDSKPSFGHMLDGGLRKGGSVMCLPIVYNHEVLGIIYVGSDIELAINHDHYKLMQAISRQVSTAIKNINLIAHLEQQKQTLEQKVYERVAEIEHQKLALTAMNATLEQANLRQQDLLNSLRSASAELERQNREDVLTGLYNRRHMDEFVAREYERALRQDSPMTIAMIDVDHFKLVNDQFSHQIGDETLKALGVILPAAVRALDLVARYGGEEILLCMPDTTLADGIVVAERARAAIEAHDWEALAPGLNITASFGVVQACEDGVAAMLARCDEKLYQAKRSGRNKVCA